LRFDAHVGELGGEVSVALEGAHGSEASDE